MAYLPCSSHDLLLVDVQVSAHELQRWAAINEGSGVRAQYGLVFIHSGDVTRLLNSSWDNLRAEKADGQLPAQIRHVAGHKSGGEKTAGWGASNNNSRQEFQIKHGLQLRLWAVFELSVVF